MYFTATITAARILKGQLEGKTFGEEAELNFERFPNVAIAKVSEAHFPFFIPICSSHLCRLLLSFPSPF